MTESLPDWLVTLNRLMHKDAGSRNYYGKIGRPFHDLDEESIIALHEEGWSNRKISRESLIPSRTVDRRINRLKKEGRIK